jgi:integrase
MGTPRLRSGKWYIRYVDAAGRRKQTVTTAKTKTEAKRLTTEIERQVERQRLGLEPVRGAMTQTFWQLCQWWVDKRCRPRSRKDEGYRLGKHVKDTALGGMPIGQVTKSSIADRLREMEDAGAAPASINKLRSILHTVISRAMQEDPPLWAGPNPVDLVQSRRVPKRVYYLLAPDEIETVLRWTPAAWRGTFAAAIYMGLRKGEISGLRPEDVDLDHGLLVVRRSFDNRYTKTDEESTLPIPPPMIPYLQEALNRGGQWVFPGRGGKMRGEEADPQEVLARVLGRAGIVIRYDYVCRRCKHAGIEPHTWAHRTKEDRRCERCGMRLWPVPIPRPVRFHDLRHSMATCLLNKGLDLKYVQRLLRHAHISTTANLYTHVVAEDVRASMVAAWGRALTADRGPKPPSGGPRAGQGPAEGRESESPDSRKRPGKSGLYLAWALQDSNQ